MEVGLLALRCLSQFMDQRMIESKQTELKEIWWVIMHIPLIVESFSIYTCLQLEIFLGYLLFSLPNTLTLSLIKDI